MLDEIMQIVKEVEIIEQVRSRNKNIELIIKPDKIILNFNNTINDLKMTLEIIQEDKNYKVHILPNNIYRTVDLEGLEHIILSLEKQMDIKRLSEKEIQQIKDKYHKGMKIELLKMYDYLAPIEPHTKGIIDHVDGIGQIHVIWESGRTLALNEKIDEFEIIK